MLKIAVVNDKMPPFGNVVKTVASEFGQGYSEQFTQAISWALSIQPQDRPQSVREFARALGLVTPHGMSSFDWRAELGPACLPAGKLPGVAAGHAPTVEKTRPNSTNPDYAPTQFIDADDDSDESSSVAAKWGPDSTPGSPGATPAERRHRPREPLRQPVAVERQTSDRRKKPATGAGKRSSARQLKPAVVWLLIASFSLLSAVAATWGWRNWAAKGNAVVPIVVAQPEEVILSSTPAPPLPPSSEPIASATEVETIIESSRPTPAPAASAAADKLTKAAERQRLAASKPAKAEAPRAVAVPETATTPAPASAPQPAPEPRPEVQAASAEKLCADANFLSRPMCMFRACQRPDLSGTAACVELQRNLQRSKEASENSKF